jgi:hypothetical protein
MLHKINFPVGDLEFLSAEAIGLTVANPVE